MNKPIIIGAGVTLAALGITPYFIGNGIEQNVTDIVTELNKQAVYSANIKSYQKGWFSTTAEIEIGIDVNALVAAQQMGNSNLSSEDNPSITATLEAHHGPLYFGNGQGIGRAHYTVSINGDKLREYAQWDATKPAYVNEGVIGLFGGISYTDEIPAMTATDEESGINFLFSGYKGEATTQGEEVVYKSTGESLSIGADEFSVNMKSLSVDMSYAGDLVRAVQGELFDSKMTASVASIEVAGFEPGANVAIDNLTLVANTDINNDEKTANVYVEYAIEKLVGPEIDASDMTLGVAINNLSTDFLKAYQDFSNESLMLPADEMTAKMMAFFEDNALSQLTAEPEINITKLSATLPEGSFNAHANTKLVGITALPETMADIGYWVTHLLADAKVTADKAFAESVTSGYMVSQIMASPQAQDMTQEEVEAAAKQQVPMMLDVFTQQGFIKETEGGYETVVELKDGKANINGTPIPLPFAPQ